MKEIYIFDNSFPEVNISVEISKDKGRMLKELVRKHSYVPGMTCVEIILYPEFSRSNRQARISGRTMDAGNHRLGYY